MTRSRRPAAHLLFAALATALLVLALAGTATTNAAEEVLVGRYTGSTDQGRDVALRVERDGNKLLIGSFTGSLAAQCPPAGAVTVGFGGGKGTPLPADGRVKFTTESDSVTVNLILGGTAIVGNIEYSSARCKKVVHFTAHLQPPDPIVQAGRYVGKNSENEEIVIAVTQRRGYYELTDFKGEVPNCQRTRLGIDDTPKAVIDDDGTVDFKTLSGRVTVKVKFHHKVHAQGEIVYAHGDCREDSAFAARLKPAT